MPGPVGLAIGIGVLAVVVALFVLGRVFRGPSTGSSIAAQLEAAQRAYPKPDRRLAEAPVSPGVPVSLRAAVTRREEEHSVWLEYAVDPGTGTAVWEASVTLGGHVGGVRLDGAPFVVGYDGEDHLGPKGLVGTTFIPLPGGAPGVDDGNLRLATLGRADAGAPIELTVTLTPTTPYASARFAVWIGAAPPAA
jgi:hypothetical protein